MMKVCKFSFSILFLLLSVGVLAKDKTPIFLSPVNFPPWIELNEKNKVVGGIMTQYHSGIDKATGIKSHIKAVPLSRFLGASLKNKGFDITLVSKPYLENSTDYKIIKQPFNSGRIFLIYNSKFKSCHNIKSIAVIRSKQETILLKGQCKEDLKIIKVENIQQRLKLMYSGRVDSAIVGEQEIRRSKHIEYKELYSKHRLKELYKRDSHIFILKNSVYDKLDIIEKLNKISKKNYLESLIVMPDVMQSNVD